AIFNFISAGLYCFKIYFACVSNLIKVKRCTKYTFIHQGSFQGIHIMVAADVEVFAFRCTYNRTENLPGCVSANEQDDNNNGKDYFFHVVYKLKQKTPQSAGLQSF